VIVGGIVVVGGVGVVRSFSRFETVDHDHGGLSLFGQQTGLVLFFTEEKWIFVCSCSSLKKIQPLQHTTHHKQQ
jgi:hypothetical protein